MTDNPHPKPPGRHMKPDCKSEQIVKLRQEGKRWAEIAAAVQSTVGSCRVLYHKRKHRTKRMLAQEAT